MKKAAVLCLLFAFCCLFFAACASAPQASEESATEKQILMVYMIGSDLEERSGLASADIEEMLACDTDNSLRLYLITGGCERWKLDISAEEISVFQISHHTLEKRASFPPANMAAPETLSNCLKEIHSLEGDGSYSLILWDHGMGPLEGYGVDTLFGSRSMKLSALKTALENSPFGPENKFRWVGFDACFMASLETASLLSDYADYLIASQEAEPRFGWDYSFVSALNSDTTEEQAIDIIDHYSEYYETLSASLPNYSPVTTLSCLDLHEAEETCQALDALIECIDEEVFGDYLARFARERKSFVDIGRFTTGLSYDLIDIGALTDAFEELAPTETAALKQTLERLVLYNRSNVNYASGLSIYCPFSNTDEYDASWKSTFADVASSKAYYGFMDQLVRAYQASESTCFDTDMTPTVTSVEGGYSIDLRLNEEQEKYFASAVLWVFSREDFRNTDEGALVLRLALGDEQYQEDLRIVSTFFDGRLLYASNDAGETQGILALSPDRDRYLSFGAMGKPWDLGISYDDLYKDCNLQIEYREDTDSMQVVGAVPTSGSDLTFNQFYALGKEDLDLRDWSYIEFYSLPYKLLSDGHVEDTGNVVIAYYTIDGDIELLYQDQGEDLFALYVVMDLAGNTWMTKAVPIP